jgi:hypothetical protein
MNTQFLEDSCNKRDEDDDDEKEKALCISEDFKSSPLYLIVVFYYNVMLNVFTRTCGTKLFKPMKTLARPSPLKRWNT